MKCNSNVMTTFLILLALGREEFDNPPRGRVPDVYAVGNSLTKATFVRPVTSSI